MRKIKRKTVEHSAIREIKRKQGKITKGNCLVRAFLRAGFRRDVKEAVKGQSLAGRTSFGTKSRYTF